MIIMAEKQEEQNRILSLCAKSPFGCKIAATAHAYGFDKKFACFWFDTDGNAVYCMVDNLMLISGTVTNPNETKEFIRAVGADKIMCAVRNSEVLLLKPEEQGDVLKKEIPAYQKAEPPHQEDIRIREIYTLLEETGMTDEFEAFYLDLSHKLRHGAAFVLEERIEDELAGCLVVSAVTGSNSIISAVAVQENYRRQGLGTKLMKRAEGQLAGKTAYIYKEHGKNEEFYKSLGYAKTDTWVQAAV